MDNYYVVKIIDDKTIIINAGAKDNVKVGDEFEIYFDSESIIDPITKENLGSYTIIKDCVKVANVFDKISICKGLTVPSPMLNTMTALSNLLTSECKSLNVDKTDISGYGNDTSKIKVGDRVRKKIILPLPNKSTKN